MVFRNLFRRWIPHGSFVHGVSVLASGAVLGQIIQILSTPILTRIYSPSEFGGLGVFIGLLGPITAVACFRFEMAIPLPKRAAAAYQVVGLALLSLVLVTALTAILGLGPGQELLTKSSNGSLAGMYWLLPVGVFLGGFYQLSSMWAVRNKAFGVIAKTRVQQGGGGAAMQVGLGLLRAGTFGLVIGQIAGQALGLVRLTGKLLKDYGAQTSKISTRGIYWALLRYKRFLTYDTLAALLNTSGAQVPAILFALYFSPALAGAYMLSVRVFSAPITLVGKALIQAMLPDLVAARNGGGLPLIIRKLSMTLSALSTGPFFIMALLSPALFGHIFGGEWKGAGFVAAWTALWVGFQFIYSPLSVVLMAVEAQKMNLILQLISFSTRLLAIYICVEAGLSGRLIVVYSVVSALFYMFATPLVEWRSGVPLGTSVKQMLVGLAGGVMVAVPTAISLKYDRTFYVPVVGVMVSCLVWIIWLRFVFGRIRLLSGLGIIQVST